jgi:hypothetical protein
MRSSAGGFKVRPQRQRVIKPESDQEWNRCLPRVPGDKPRRLAESVSAVGWFVLHTCVAMSVDPVVVVLANPFMWMPAIALGSHVDRRTHTRLACWVYRLAPDTPPPDQSHSCCSVGLFLLLDMETEIAAACSDKMQ